MVRKLFISIAALSFIVGCSIVMEETHEGAGEIIVTTSVDTKAGYEGTTVLPTNFVMDIDQKVAEYNYFMVHMTKESTGNRYNAPEGTKLEWAFTDHSDVSIKALTYPQGRTTVDDANPMDINILTDQTTEENVKACDLLGAVSNKDNNGDITIKGNSISVKFNHLMSKLYVVYDFTDDVKNKGITINSLTLQNVCIKGGYNYAVMAQAEEVTKAYGDINMYHDTEGQTAEAVFYPYKPTENPVLILKATYNNNARNYECPIVLKSENGFVGGKRYKMTVKIKGFDIDDVEVSVNDWISDEGSIVPDDAERVLWVGTSIPAGDIVHGNNGGTQSVTTDPGVNNYPKMVADELGIKVYNNARGSSFVCFYPAEEDGTINWKDASDWSVYSNEVWKGYSLSATFEEIDAKFIPLGVPEWLINSFKSHSWESLIKPYIDGTLAKCTTIIFDHGYNDRDMILNECSWHPGAGETQFAVGSGWDWLYNLRDTRNQESESYFQGLWWDDYNVQNGSTGVKARKNHYFYAMTYLIKRCLEINPKIKIVFGNYFAWKNPYAFTNDKFCNFICAANEALAGMWMRPIVNVYEYTGIRNVGGDFDKFCPDHVHPHSDPTGESNRIIAGAYINELRGIVKSGK